MTLHRPGGLVAAALVAAILAAPAIAAAHNSPSANSGQIHISLAIAPQRVRLAYTIIFGHAATKAAQSRMDRSRDGVASAAEHKAYAAEVAGEIESQLTLTVDGQAQPVTFSERYANTDAGHLAVDLILERCLSGPGEHTIALADTSHLPGTDVGQLAVLPRAVNVLAAGLSQSAAAEPNLVVGWRGQSPLATAAYQVKFRAAADSATAPGCGAQTAPSLLAVSGGRLIAGLSLALVVAVTVILFRHRNHHHPDR